MTHEKALELIAINGWKLLALTQYKYNDPAYGVYESSYILIGTGDTPLDAVKDAEMFIHGDINETNNRKRINRIST